MGIASNGREPVWPDDETTQQIAIVKPTDADAVCAEWMQRGRENARRREQRQVSR